MNYLIGLWALLKGKKSYIIAGLMILLGLLTEDTQLILEGFGFGAIRNAIK